MLGTFLRLAGSLFGWLVIAPIGLCIPRRKDWVAVIGRQDGRFLDNCKYFFLQATAQADRERFVFVTERADVQALVQSGGLEALRYPSWRGAWFLLRCGAVVVDEARWFAHGRFFFLLGAKKVQLWHGIGFKWVELGLWKHEAGHKHWFSNPLILIPRLVVYRFIGRRVRYGLFLCTSSFYYNEVFKPAFLAKQFLLAGYPRNDFAQNLQGKQLALAWSNVDDAPKSALPAWQVQERKLVMIAPTFRDTGSVPMQLSTDVLQRLDAFAQQHNVEFLFKFHPSEKNVDKVAGQHFHVCARDSDIYPLIPYLSALVTDYSSIAMDFLLVDKPLLYLIPEGDDYVEKDRQLQFDPFSMMPGPIVPDWDALMTNLLQQWVNDDYKHQRAALRMKAFDDLPQADATAKIIAALAVD